MAYEAVLRKKAVIRNASELYKFCCENISEVGKSAYKCRKEYYQCSLRNFIYVEASEISRSNKNRDVKTLPGSRQIHSVQSTGTFI